MTWVVYYIAYRIRHCFAGRLLEKVTQIAHYECGQLVSSLPTSVSSSY